MSEQQSRREEAYSDALAALENLWEAEEGVGEEHWAYRQAAAVLDVFDPESLRPFDGALHVRPEEDDAGLPELMADATCVNPAPPAQWRLTEEVRIETLERMGDRATMLAALEANPERPATPVQRMLEAILREKLPPVNTLGRDELRGVLAVCRWLQGVLPEHELPDSQVVAGAFARADLLAPCHHLLADGFVDRKRQLKTLEEFLSADTPSPPLMLYGIGGVGKSTLLAKLTVDAVAAYGERLLCVPIDVDRPGVRPHRPHTFMVEAIHQIVRQVPEFGGDAESRIQHLRELGSRYAISDTGEDFEGDRYSEKDVDWMQQEMVDVVRDLLSLPLGAGEGRALITIDTFEEAQVFGPEVSRQLVQLFDRLARTHPGVRVIFSGRVPANEPGRPPDHPQSWMEEQLLPGSTGILLKGLDKRSAVTLLAEQLKDQRPVPPRKDLEEVVSVVGRNPMCIKLAARIIRMQGVAALLNAETREALLRHLRDAKIQAFLFGRVLDHFQKERIKPLAYPGLIVRRVTPDIIRDVLAGPCGIELAGDDEAQALYDDLARERTLVEHDGIGGLRYRPELRRELLDDVIRKVSKETAAAIDRAAVAFYERDDSRGARAEEIYHRLRLGENLDAIHERWMPGLRDLLRTSLVELPHAGHVWLSKKLNVTTDAATRNKADQGDWEQLAALRAERSLKRGDGDAALAAVRERAERLPNSPLYQLEAEALRVNGDLDAARDVCERGLARATGDRRAELLLQMASLHEAVEALDAALPLVAEAASVAEGHEDNMLPFRALITHIRVLRKLGRTEERDRLRAEALSRLDRDVMKDLRKYPRLFEETAAELGKENPEVLRAAVQRLGVQVRSTAQEEALADALHESWEDGLESKVAVPKILDKDLVKRMGESKRAAEEIVRQSEGAGLGRFASDLLKSGASKSASASRLADFFRASVDQGLNVGQWTKKM